MLRGRLQHATAAPAHNHGRDQDTRGNSAQHDVVPAERQCLSDCEAREGRARARQPSRRHAVYPVALGTVEPHVLVVGWIPEGDHVTPIAASVEVIGHILQQPGAAAGTRSIQRGDEEHLHFGHIRQ